MTYVLNGMQHYGQKFPIATHSFSLFYMNKHSDFFHFCFAGSTYSVGPCNCRVERRSGIYSSLSYIERHVVDTMADYLYHIRLSFVCIIFVVI